MTAGFTAPDKNLGSSEVPGMVNNVDDGFYKYFDPSVIYWIHFSEEAEAFLIMKPIPAMKFNEIVE